MFRLFSTAGSLCVLGVVYGLLGVAGPCDLLGGPAPCAAGALAVARASPPPSLSTPRAQGEAPVLLAQVSSVCVTYYGSCTLLYPLPIGSACFCPTPYGPVQGQVQ